MSALWRFCSQWKCWSFSSAFLPESTSDGHQRKVEEFYSFIDEFLNLFKGQIGIDELKNMTYKESSMLKKAREARLKREYEASKGSIKMEDLEDLM